jgi:hypothetical protein
LGGWPQFIAAIEAEFGGDDRGKSIKALLALKQIHSVAEYIHEFQAVTYQVLMFNPNYDDQFFISHFIKGLKWELRGAVESQVPATLERAFMLARVQQDLSDEIKQKGPR